MTKKQINSLIYKTNKQEKALYWILLDSISLFNYISDEEILNSTNKNIDEIIEMVLSLKRGYISMLSDLSYQMTKLYRLKSMMESECTDNKVDSTKFLKIDFDDLFATTAEEIEKANMLEEDDKALSALLDEFYTKGWEEGKTDEQLDKEWDEFLEGYMNSKYNLGKSFNGPYTKHYD